eukprot:CAMPEP_0202707464 /NCGR_PEP_ID=MMETSP1385-20130828/19796_1 /ASSEMBLY_ACC=CAM_ASM_000861 /TAXON_ID=933848 /ORGANISM="Elphidium margaritaceum" /LENGTH=234 /DNA_ID=CAMNT_0049366191 /DNA_START=48 /DNA_END=752 /DNA_ORIENTATION=-
MTSLTTNLSGDDKKVVLYMSSFIVTHTIMSHGVVRDALIKALGGTSRFISTYAVTSFATLGPAAWIYFRRSKGTGESVPALANNSQLLSNLGLILAMKAAFMIPLLGSGKGIDVDQKKAVDSVRVTGIIRITRHSLFWMFAVLSASQILRGQKYSDVCFHLPLIVEALFGALHQDQRLRQVYPKQFYEQTSWFPWLAVLGGQQSAVQAFKEIGVTRFAVSTLLSLATYWYCTKK